jgi:DNA mismatch endonuclease (patch repair protein)
MPDVTLASQCHHNLATVPSVSTKPELMLRHNLWYRGFRYRINDKRLPGSPDVVLPKYRTVVFVHGCFWHGHKGCKKYTIPKTNTDFWVKKVARNQQRDQEVWRQLEAKDWSVIIVWECELEKKRFDETIDRVEKEIIENGRLHEQRRKERRLLREQRQRERRVQKARQDALMKELKHIDL